MSVAISVAQIAETHAREKNASRILSVTVEVGELSGVMPDALAFCYEAAVKGSLAEGSQLVIEKIAAKAQCPDCGLSFAPENRIFICPKCEGLSAAMVAGEELAVRQMEIE
ncbi:MAG: hydrogenase maturation nickel metallochaperone HypA [Nitrospinae bacterium]|nr:hydrogenase maturation nickel metallochaperone HypA [Nitrospinota bacterium]